MEVVDNKTESTILEENTVEPDKQTDTIAVNGEDSLNRKYCIVIGSFKDSINALHLKDKMKKKNYEPEIRDTVFNLQDTMHRVIVASFDSFEDANAFKESNKNAFKDKNRPSDIWIRNPIPQDDKNTVQPPSVVVTVRGTKHGTSLWEDICNWLKKYWIVILIIALVIVLIVPIGVYSLLNTIYNPQEILIKWGKKRIIKWIIKRELKKILTAPFKWIKSKLIT
jgi:hypothetical protein